MANMSSPIFRALRSPISGNTLAAHDSEAGTVIFKANYDAQNNMVHLEASRVNNAGSPPTFQSLRMPTDKDMPSFSNSPNITAVDLGGRRGRLYYLNKDKRIGLWDYTIDTNQNRLTTDGISVAVESIRDIEPRTSLGALSFEDPHGKAGRVHQVVWQDPDNNLRYRTQIANRWSPQSEPNQPSPFIDSTIDRLGTISANCIGGIPHVLFHLREENGLQDTLKCFVDLDPTGTSKYQRKAAFDLPTYQATFTYGPFSMCGIQFAGEDPAVILQREELVFFNYMRKAPGPEYREDQGFQQSGAKADARTPLASVVTPQNVKGGHQPGGIQPNALFVFYMNDNQLYCKMRDSGGKWSAPVRVQT